jgi:trigger factor
MEFTLKVTSIKAQKLPEINDDFAKSLGEYADLADLREKIRLELMRTRQAASKREAVEESVRLLLEQTTIDLPSSAVEEEEEAILRKAVEQLAGRGITPQLVEEWRPRAHEQAVLNLKRNLLLRKIAERESLAVTEEDLDREISLLAQANNVPAARMMEVFNAEGRREGLQASLILRKAVDFLADQAIME